MNLLKIVWTAEVVEEWLDIAVKVDRILPRPGPRMAKMRFPETPQDLSSLLWDELVGEIPESKFQPTNEQVSMYEEVVLHWLPMVADLMDRKILWLRACGCSWPRVAKIVHSERHLVSGFYKSAVENLAKKLALYYKSLQPITISTDIKR